MESAREITRSSAVVFSSAPYRPVLEGRPSPRLTTALEALALELGAPPGARRGEIIARTWRWKLQNRRDDAAIRSLLFAGIRAGSLTPSGRDFALELRAAGSVIDFASLAPGCEEGFEIKSRFDSLSRLPQQVTAFRKVFSRVSLVVDQTIASRVEDHAAYRGLGLVVVGGSRSNWSLERIRLADPDASRLSIAALMNVLRRDEIRAVASELCGVELDPRPAEVFADAERVLRTVPIEALASSVYRSVSSRRRLNARALARGVPAPLRAVMAEIDPFPAQLWGLRGWLGSEV